MKHPLQKNFTVKTTVGEMCLFGGCITSKGGIRIYIIDATQSISQVVKHGFRDLEAIEKTRTFTWFRAHRANSIPHIRMFLVVSYDKSNLRQLVNEAAQFLFEFEK